MATIKPMVDGGTEGFKVGQGVGMDAGQGVGTQGMQHLLLPGGGGAPGGQRAHGSRHAGIGTLKHEQPWEQENKLRKACTVKELRKFVAGMSRLSPTHNPHHVTTQVSLDMPMTDVGQA